MNKPFKCESLYESYIWVPMKTGKPGKMKMVIEKSWSMKNWPKVMEVMEFYQFCPQFVLNLFFLVTTKKLSSGLESLHVLTFSEKRCKFKIGETDGHEKSRNGHGKVIEKYFLKSVGTLIYVL